MTDREEFEKFWESHRLYPDWNTTVWKAWQARGELDAVRIKELEADLDDRKREVNLRCGQIQERDIRIAELTAKNKELEELIKRAMIPTQEAMQQSQGNPVVLRQGSKLVAGHSGVFVEETK